MRLRPRTLIPIVAALLAGPVQSTTTTIQIIDGLPQVIAPQQVIVRCSPGLLGLCTTALNSVGAIVGSLGLGDFQLALLPPNTPLQPVLDLLRATLGIASAEPNRILIGSTVYPQTWEFPAANAPGDHSLMTAASHPIVALLDSGAAYENYADASGTYAMAPVFATTKFAQGWDFVNNDAHPNDDTGHGTAMASIIVGAGSFSSSAIPYVGSASGAVIMPVKILDATNQGTEFWLAEGIRYAVQSGAEVINLSVGAVRLDATYGYAVTSYSNFGDALDLVAPGGMPHQDVNGDGLWDGDLAQSFPPGSPTQISWWLVAGTSPATAHTSAAAAALIGAGVAPEAVRPLLQATAAPMGSGGWTAAAGSGRLQTAAALSRASTFVADAPLYADAAVALRADGRASAAVMIADANGEGGANVEVHVRW